MCQSSAQPAVFCGTSHFIFKYSLVFVKASEPIFFTLDGIKISFPSAQPLNAPLLISFTDEGIFTPPPYFPKINKAVFSTGGGILCLQNLLEPNFSFRPNIPCFSAVLRRQKKVLCCSC